MAYDPFALGGNAPAGQYTVGAVLAGQNPTIGPANPSFFTGPWFSAPGVGTQTVQATSVGSTLIGGSAVGLGRASRQLRTLWDDTTSGTFYMGFQVNFGVIAGGDMGYRAVEFYPTSVATPGENRVGDIGYNEYNGVLGSSQQTASTAKMQFNWGDTHVTVDGAPDTYLLDGADHLIVYKFVFSTMAASDSITVFLDPKSATEPVIPSVSMTEANVTLAWIGPASFGSVIAGTTTAFDELRVGTTFADVVPEFPTPGDTNGDDLVDLVDFGAISSHFNQTGQTLATGDVTGDKRVTLADWRLWRDNRTDVGAGFAAGLDIPEPAGAVLGLLALVALAGATRRKT